ncbi:uncharacterized protein RHO17_007323 isoform 1-T3 [Thomomys bottae]
MMNPAEGELMTSPALEQASSVKELSKHYDLLRTLGQGTFAEVKLAKHKISRKTVAIKIINKVDDSNHPCSEGLILRSLNHPRIVKLYHILESPKTTCLVLEYATQGDLLEYVIEYKRLKEDEACRIFHQLVDAIEFCHKNYVVHRDLKPENILIDNDYNIKLSDFGLSAFFSDEKQLELYCGTLPFMAPEIIKCQPYHGPEVDIWSLGVILFYMVTGSVPFPSEDFIELERQFLQLRKVIPAYLSPELHALICDILNVNPLERPPVAYIKRHPWLKNLPPCCMETKCKASSDRVTKAMCALGFSLRDIKESLQNDQYNSTMATYLLLEEMAPEDAVSDAQSKVQDQGNNPCKPPTIILSVTERDIKPSRHHVTSPLQPYKTEDEANSSEESSKASPAPPCPLRYRRLISSSAWNPSGLPGADVVPVYTSGSRRHYGQHIISFPWNPSAEPGANLEPVCMSGSRTHLRQPASSSSGNSLAKPDADPVPVCMSESEKQIDIRDLFLAPSSQGNLVEWSAGATCLKGTSANSQGLGSSVHVEQTLTVGKATTANSETKHSSSLYSRVVLVNLTRWCYPVSTKSTHNLRINKSIQVSMTKSTLHSAFHSRVTPMDVDHSIQTYSAAHSSLRKDDLSDEPQVAPTIKCNTEDINPIDKLKNTPLTKSRSTFTTTDAGYRIKYYSSFQSSLPENDLSSQPQVAPVTNHDSGDIVPIEDSMKNDTPPAEGSREVTIEKSDTQHDSSIIDKDKQTTDFKRSHRTIPRRILSCLRKLCCCCCLGTKVRCPKLGKKVAPQSCQHPD